jgi:hypothetical protein
VLPADGEPLARETVELPAPDALQFTVEGKGSNVKPSRLVVMLAS